MSTKPTINDIATIPGTPQNTSIKKRLARSGAPHGVNDPLSDQAIRLIREWYQLNGELDRLIGPGKPEPDIPKPEPPPTALPPNPDPAPDQGNPEPETEHWTSRILPVLPLPMLGLAASYGVYFFADQFVPTSIALAEAAAFELTYIGLGALRRMTDHQRVIARRVSWGAVAVSVIYNTITAAIHQDPTIITELPRFWFWTVSILHGAPLAILAYFVSDLLLHRD